MNIQRRKVLRGGFALGFLSSIPSLLFANWPKVAFQTESFQDALKEVIGNSQLMNKKVKLTLPKIAENGGQVRIEVEVAAKDVEWIAIFVEKNPIPFISKFMMLENTIPHISTNIKVRETSKVLVVAKASNQFYSAKQEVKVTAGGCA